MTLPKDQTVLRLDADNAWSQPAFRQHLVASLLSDGLPERAVALLDKILRDSGAGSFEQFSEAAERRRSQLSPGDGDLVGKALAHLEHVRAHNLSVYDSPTPEDYKRRYWPNNAKLRQTNWEYFEDLYEADLTVTPRRFIDKATPITSAGSCFAANIARQLQHWGYNYLVEMPQLRRGREPIGDYSTDPAACGNIYNAVSMRQVVERAFGEWDPPKILVNSRKAYRDAFRAFTDFDSIEGYHQKWQEHNVALGRAFKKSKVFILTLGMTEAWFIGGTDFATSTSPRRCDPTLFRHKNLSVDDNVRELERLYAVFKRHNPDIKIITTVSPVPLNATFRSDEHVVVANGLSKSTLRVALDAFSRQHPEDVYYFPSYEIVTVATRNPWEIDLRHVSNEAVERVMRHFQRMYLVDQAPLEVLKSTPIEDLIPQRRNPALRYARQFIVHPLKRQLGIEGRPFTDLLKPTARDKHG